MFFLETVVGFRRKDRQVEIQVSCSCQVSQRLLGACQICKCLATRVCMTEIVPPTEDPVSPRNVL